MPDSIRHPVPFWIPAFAGMTTVGYLTAGVLAFRVLVILIEPGVTNFYNDDQGRHQSQQYKQKQIEPGRCQVVMVRHI